LGAAALARVERPVREALEDWLGPEAPPADEEAPPGPPYVLVASKGRTMGLDRGGRVTQQGEICDITGIPVLTGVPPIVDGRGLRPSMPRLVLGFCILRAFERSPNMMKCLAEIDVETLEQPRVVLSDGLTAELGCGRYPEKVERLAQVRLQASQLGIRPKRVDLRFGRQVIVQCDRNRPRSDKEA
jgi:hypothetical protein